MPKRISYTRAPSGRTVELEQAIAEASDAKSVTVGAPEDIKEGQINFTFMYDTGDHLVARVVYFDWDRGNTATWWQDISDHEAASPAPSAPARGWAAWGNGEDLLVAYTWPEVGVEGWARVRDAAPASEYIYDDREYAMYDPETWVELAQTIAAILHEEDLPSMTGQRFKT
jgi:hypothetical protein